MSFFKKKKTDLENSQENFPSFPSTFAPEIKFPEFPKYSEDESDSVEKKDYESLLDRPLFGKKIQQLDINGNVSEESSKDALEKLNMGKNAFPAAMSDDKRSRIYNENKPLFVRIDKYEQAIYTIEKIKEKLRTSDRILEELTRIRAEEEKQLDQWKNDVANIKTKLLDIDRQLFET